MKMNTMQTMNPFDETFQPGKGTINPFDDVYEGGMTPYNDDAESYNDNLETETAPFEDDAPAEASWQYLGDLPYRRVPIYSNVRWENAQRSSHKTNPGNVHFGLASFPSAALHHGTNQFTNNPRVVLSKTTVTKCVGCPNGGPIAVITLPLTSASIGFTHTELRIMTVSGKSLARLEFPPPYLDRKYTPSDVLTIGFTSRCVLIVVLKDSLCLTFDLRGEPVLPPFHVIENGIDLQLAHVYEGGVAVLAINKDCAIAELFDNHDDTEYLKSVHSSAQRILPVSTDLSGTAVAAHHDTMPPYYAVVTYLPTANFAAMNLCHYCAIAVLPRNRTLNRHPEVFLSTSDNSVIIVDTATTRHVDVNCRARIASPIVDMSFAPNGRFLACFTEASLLTVISTSFETKVLDFDTSEGSNSPPLEMKWCGEDSVVLHWKNLGILMVGPYGDWLRFPYDGTDNLFVLPELDCCRVITDSGVEILQRVPPATALLLRIGSIETTAMLLDASDAYHSGSNVTDDAIRSIIHTGLLEEAIETCADSAMKEFDIPTQKRLLRAASYGMHFTYKMGMEGDQSVLIGGPFAGSDLETRILPSKTAVNFVEAARKLRILNALRNPDVGFLLTAPQLDAMSSTGVIARLVAMKRPSLANEICRYLCLPKSVQLFTRASKASALVESSPHLSDAETAERAIKIINGDPTDGSTSTTLNRGAFAAVALAANKAGRPGVASLLLMLESSVAEKVPALISTGAYADALAVATSSRDADFIFLTLMEYERACMVSASATDVTRAQATFLATVVSKFTPESFHTLRRYLEASSDTKSLTALLLKAQRFTDTGIVMAAKAVRADDFREKQGMLAEASRLFGLGKETTFHKTSTDDYIELLKDQETLRAKYGSPDVAPVSSSVSVTIASVLRYAARSQDQREKNQLLADADKLARKARMSQKRFWHIKVKACTDGGHWTNLKELAETRQIPIGHKPLARAAIKGYHNDNRDAYIQFFIQKLSSVEEKFDMLCEAGMWKQALHVAEKEMKDIRRVKLVKDRCNDKPLQLEADQAMGRLAT